MSLGLLLPPHPNPHHTSNTMTPRLSNTSKTARHDNMYILLCLMCLCLMHVSVPYDMYVLLCRMCLCLMSVLFPHHPPPPPYMQHHDTKTDPTEHMGTGESVAVCCSVLQYVAVSCSVLTSISGRGKRRRAQETARQEGQSAREDRQDRERREKQEDCKGGGQEARGK